MAHAKGLRAWLRGSQRMQGHQQEGATSPRPKRARTENDAMEPGEKCDHGSGSPLRCCALGQSATPLDPCVDQD